MTVVGITGHQQIPLAAAAYVGREIRAHLERLGPDFVGVSSLADGADQLFAELVIEYGGKLHAIIPSQHYDRTFTDPRSLRRYESLLAQATDVSRLDHFEPSEDAFYDAGRKVADASDVVLAVWDGEAARGRGGTADIVRYAREHGKEVEVIWPAGVRR